jgi:ferredoxin
MYENKAWVWGYRENDPMGGHDPYSASKGCAELVFSAYLKSFFSQNASQGMLIGAASTKAGNVIGGGDWGERFEFSKISSGFLLGSDFLKKGTRLMILPADAEQLFRYGDTVHFKILSYGPCSPEVRRVNRVLAATDAVALDAVFARMVGFRIDEVPYLRIARELELGRTDPDAIEIEGDGSPIEGFNRPVVTPESTYGYLSGVGGGRTSRAFYADRVCYRPVIVARNCSPGCTACADACPSGALKPGHPPVLTSSECMLCSACMEACIHDAIRLLPDKVLRDKIKL